MTNKTINAYWCNHPNFGDEMTRFFIQKKTNKTVLYTMPEENVEKYMLTGSILNHQVTKSTVFGCGLAYANDYVPKHEKIISTRGKLSYMKARETNKMDKMLFGDPALLLPFLYMPLVEKKYKLGIIPHYVDYDIVKNKMQMLPENVRESILLIDVLMPVQDVINNINRCEKSISSSLHGIITSHAYGVPCEWVVFSNKILGDDFKYHDYFDSINVMAKKHVVSSTLDIMKLYETNMPKPNINIDLEYLFSQCPI